MRTPGAVQVLRSAQAARQSRRAWPLPGHVRLHAASSRVQALGHVAAAPPRVAASNRATLATTDRARRGDRYPEPTAGRCGVSIRSGGGERRCFPRSRPDVRKRTGRWHPAPLHARPLQGPAARVRERTGNLDVYARGRARGGATPVARWNPSQPPASDCPRAVLAEPAATVEGCRRRSRTRL
jgi:hypothetical protein